MVDQLCLIFGPPPGSTTGDWKQCEVFESYSLDSDLSSSACAFSFEISAPELIKRNIPITAGMQCKVLLNGHVELTGFIDRVENSYDKYSHSVKVSGRDLMGLLADSCCELSDCTVLGDITLVAAAQCLVRNLPVLGRGAARISIQGGIRNIAPVGYLQIEPGMKIFDILSRYASMRGLIFYGTPDGSMVFGKAKTNSLPLDPTFALTCCKDGRGNNIESLTVSEDISKAASKVIVVSQGEGGGAFGGAEVSAEYANSEFPSSFYKPLVLTQNGDLDSPAALAKMTVEQMRRDQYALTCKVAGHSQAGTNWKINCFASVNDEIAGVRGDFLIYGRTFTQSKTEGTHTELRLGLAGLEPV